MSGPKPIPPRVVKVDPFPTWLYVLFGVLVLLATFAGYAEYRHDRHLLEAPLSCPCGDR